jgi:hypothetical protein
MEERSTFDTRRPKAVDGVKPEMAIPVSSMEYSDGSKAWQTEHRVKMVSRVRPYGLRKLDPDCTRLHMNLWLLCGRPPTLFRDSITSLIPKSADASKPEDHRPITMGPMVARIFHKILAHRMQSLMPLSNRQKAFRRGDGLTDNIWILRSILRDRKAKNKLLSICFIDVAKAFDSVSHETLLLAAGRFGVPPILLEYLRNLYSNSSTQLKSRTLRSRVIAVRRGVRQGDPMSPLLFNGVIDWALSGLNSKLGVGVGAGTKVNHLAFADDIALVGVSRAEIVLLAKEFEASIGLAGLLPNAKKSATISFTGDKTGRIHCSIPFLTLGGVVVPALSIDEAYKYLGISMGCTDRANPAETKLKTGLDRVTRAPLKPQQRLYLLRTHLLPSLHHPLVLDKVTDKTLRRLDVAVRKSMRQWLHLPKDVPLAMFHSPVKEGGFGIPQLRYQIPNLRRARVTGLAERAGTGNDPVLAAVYQESGYLGKKLARVEKSRVCYAGVASSKESVIEATINSLHDSIDGRGLKLCADVPSVHHWVANGTSLLTGRGYIRAVQVRAASLPTPMRNVRGRDKAKGKCDACGLRGTLGHVLQVCPRTHNIRVKRHNRLMDLITGQLQKIGYRTWSEPIIEGRRGVRWKPDLVASKPGQNPVVLDATVVSDNADPDSEHLAKCKKYDIRDIRRWVATTVGCSASDVYFTAVAFSWRGILSKRSAQSLLSLGIGRGLLEVMSVRVLEDGYRIWDVYKSSTFRQRR